MAVAWNGAVPPPPGPAETIGPRLKLQTKNTIFHMSLLSSDMQIC